MSIPSDVSAVQVLRGAAIAACLCALSACSSYEVYDAYSSHETGKQYVSFDGEAATRRSAVRDYEALRGVQE